MKRCLTSAESGSEANVVVMRGSARKTRTGAGATEGAGVGSRLAAGVRSGVAGGVILCCWSAMRVPHSLGMAASGGAGRKTGKSQYRKGSMGAAQAMDVLRSSICRHAACNLNKQQRKTACVRGVRDEGQAVLQECASRAKVAKLAQLSIVLFCGITIGTLCSLASETLLVTPFITRIGRPSLSPPPKKKANSHAPCTLSGSQFRP